MRTSEVMGLTPTLTFIIIPGISDQPYTPSKGVGLFHRFTNPCKTLRVGLRCVSTHSLPRLLISLPNALFSLPFSSLLSRHFVLSCNTFHLAPQIAVSIDSFIWCQVLGQASVVIFACFIFTGQLCYLSYGEINSGSITAELASRSNNPIILLCNLMMALAVALTYVPVSHPHYYLVVHL